MSQDHLPRTVGEILAQLRGNKSLMVFFEWPPDAFAFTSILLAESGAYRNAVDPPAGNWPPSEPADVWAFQMKKQGALWRGWAEGKTVPAEVAKRIKLIEPNKDISIVRLAEKKNWPFCQAILELHAMADEACAGVGAPGFFPRENFLFYFRAEKLLEGSNSLSTISATRVKVLPKIRTPKVGISLRSLSHNLAVDRSEVEVAWVRKTVSSLHLDPKTLNLLLIPWPDQIDPNDFKKSKGPLKNMDSRRFGFFEFSPKPKFRISQAIAMINSAQKKIGKIHGVILPECALTESEEKRLRTALYKLKIPFFVTGIRDAKKNRNFARLGVLSTWQRQYFIYDQDKHHRWLIDKDQIQNYHLGSSLHPSRDYWENTKILPRKLNIVAASDWLTMCHLICEDLARHDPVTQLVRSVGPSLVIALLLDGPQLKNRWPARYASVLADDPGSSVLTFTSLGMATRSRPTGEKPSRVIALWKDCVGRATEVVLEDDKEAVILTLCAEPRKEWTADGRQAGVGAYDLVISGINCV